MPAAEDSVVVSGPDVCWRPTSLLSDCHSMDVVDGGRVGLDGVVLYQFARRGVSACAHAMVVDGVAHVTKGPAELQGWYLYEDPLDDSDSDRRDLRVQCGSSSDDEDYAPETTGSLGGFGELTVPQLRGRLKLL